MSGSLARAAPVRFLIGVTALWTMGRGLALVGWAPSGLPLPSDKAHASTPRPIRIARAVVPETPPLLRQPEPLLPAPAWRRPQWPLVAMADAPNRRLTAPMMLTAADAGAPADPRPSGFAEAAATLSQTAASKRWSGSAWAFVRGGGRASSLAPGGQIGGGQAGARILYRLKGSFSAAARLSTAIGGPRQSEAALGLDWRPLPALPVHLMAERRIAIDRGGRNAWTLGAAGGVYDLRVAQGWRLDAYGEAGVVGARRRDFYADGAARIARAIKLGDDISLAIGGGAWGAAQPGAARLDLGPSLVLRLPVDRHVVAVSLDWRERVLGHARPGSGAALTVATDF